LVTMLNMVGGAGVGLELLAVDIFDVDCELV
jgi:hypothetical protein